MSIIKDLFRINNNDQIATKFVGVKTYNEVNINYSGMLENHDFVRSCIRPTAEAMSKFNVTARGTKAENDVKFSNLLKYPNPYSTMGDILSKCAWQLELNGNAFLWVERDGGQPVSIWNIDYSTVEMLENDNGTLVGFHFVMIDGTTMNTKFEDTIHLKDDYINKEFLGSSKRDAVRHLLSVLNASDEGIVKAVENSISAKLLVEYNSALREEDLNKNIAKFEKDMLDGKSVIGADTKYKVNQLNTTVATPTDGNVESIKERIMDVFGVNENIVTGNYTEEEYQAWFNSHVSPIVKQLETKLSRVLLTAVERGYGNDITVDSDSLEYSSSSTKLNMVALLDRGILTINEYRNIIGLEEVEDGDQRLLRMDTERIGQSTDNVGQESTQTGQIQTVTGED